MLVNLILERRKGSDNISSLPIESIDCHGLYGWLVRSLIPGFTSRVRPVNLDGYDLIYLVSPKWTYNCPPIIGFIKGQAIESKTFAIVVTYSKSNPSKYLETLSRRIEKEGGKVAGAMGVRSSEIEGPGFPGLLDDFLNRLRQNGP